MYVMCIVLNERANFWGKKYWFLFHLFVYIFIYFSRYISLHSFVFSYLQSILCWCYLNGTINISRISRSLNKYLIFNSSIAIYIMCFLLFYLFISFFLSFCMAPGIFVFFHILITRNLWKSISLYVFHLFCRNEIWFVFKYIW